MRLTDLKYEYFNIGATPCVAYGDRSAKKAVLYVHGLCGNKEEAERFARLAVPQGFCVFAADLPEHGGRTDGVKLLPWEVVPELKSFFDYLSAYYSVYLRAESIGAYFSLLSLSGKRLEKCLLISPLTDMVQMINGMLHAAGADLERLEREKVIPFGDQTISWEYYEYAKSHPIRKIADTTIISASDDYVVGAQTIKQFASISGAAFYEMQGGEHYFHTAEQLSFLEKYERKWLGGDVKQDVFAEKESFGATIEEYAELKELFLNSDKIHTTKGGAERITKNLNIVSDPVEYCKRIIFDRFSKGLFKGKNLYITLNDEQITLNRKSYTIITAKKGEIK